MDVAKHFRESLGFQNSESRLNVNLGKALRGIDTLSGEATAETVSLSLSLSLSLKKSILKENNFLTSGATFVLLE